MDGNADGGTPPSGWRIDPRYIECRTKRAPLMMPPSLHARVKAAADAKGESFNSWCLRALEVALKEAERTQEGASAGEGGTPAEPSPDASI